MQAALERIEDIGFCRIGQWIFMDDKLTLELSSDSARGEGALYAFTCESEILYIGKTSRSLRKRLNGYKNPPRDARSGASTNIRIKRNILDLATNGKAIEIYARINGEIEEHAGLQIDFAASIENSLIRALAPRWNQLSKNPLDRSKEIHVANVHIRADKKSSGSNRSPRAALEPGTKDYAKQLEMDLRSVADAGVKYLIVRSGDLHKKVGGRNSYTSCCGAMRKLMKPDDVIEKMPLKGNGGNLYIRYNLPR